MISRLSNGEIVHQRSHRGPERATVQVRHSSIEALGPDVSARIVPRRKHRRTVGAQNFCARKFCDALATDRLGRDGARQGRRAATEPLRPIVVLTRRTWDPEAATAGSASSRRSGRSATSSNRSPRSGSHRCRAAVPTRPERPSRASALRSAHAPVQTTTLAECQRRRRTGPALAGSSEGWM